MRFFLISVLALVCFNSVSQTTQKKNLSYYLRPIKWKHVPNSTRFDLQLDTRNSFINQNPTDVYGVNIGVIFHQRIRLGGGFYWVSEYTDNVYGLSPTSGKFLSINDTPLTLNQLLGLHYKPGVDFVIAEQHLDLNFGSLGIAYTFYSSKLFDLVIPVEFGYGTFREKLYDPTGKNFSDVGAATPTANTGYFFPSQIGFETITKVYRYAWLETVVGYRGTWYMVYTSGTRHSTLGEFNGLYYIIGVKLQIGTILKQIKEHKKNKKRNSNYNP